MYCATIQRGSQRVVAVTGGATVPKCLLANVATLVGLRREVLPYRENAALTRGAARAPENLSALCSRSQQAHVRVRAPASEQTRFMSLDKYELFGGDEAGEQRTTVDSYNKHGFVVNGVLIQGAVMLLPVTTLLWNVAKMEDVTIESLVAFRLLRTKPELCIFGTGRRLQRTPKSLEVVMKAMGIPYDTMDTVNALATFNVLNQEGRNVVGAFLPLDPIEVQQNYDQIKEAKEKASVEIKPQGLPEGAPWAKST